ncbi:hypothetical protein IWW38_001811 [Coemansia aciculifera]|uniref:Uncharacterized protein n=1 Tax=Coemansia aciculifera TaxID=417176 RepID=A0ACC1M593_9FUNG|nr:hypothetical protein IWW38_001811 [Coemansia aciculifera]
MDKELRETAAVRKRQSTVILPFPDGVVRLTHMAGEKENLDQAMTLSDILQPTALRKALLSTFVLDLEWLLTHFERSTKLVVVKSYDPKLEQCGVYQSEDRRVTLVNPEFSPKQAYPIMHSKIMLLFYDTYVRFVVSSANLYQDDWTLIQNIVFIQDLPYTPSVVSADTCFGSTLEGALRDISVPEPVVEQLRYINFTRVKVHIVTSVPSAEGRSQFHAESYGLDRLARVTQMIRDQELDKKEVYDVTLYCYGSSMGRLNSSYLRSFYASAVGSTPSIIQHQGGLSSSDIETKVRVGFHTLAQGENNIHGPAIQQSFKFQPEYYSDPTFPRYALRKIESKVPNTLVHAKVILARLNATRQERGWMYLGSHNFTPGAWGYKRAYGKPCFVNNYEFGVVLPHVHFESMFGRDTMTWNGSKVPLPFRLAWSEYERDEMPLVGQ